MSSFVQALIASFAKAPSVPTIGTATATGQTTASVTFTAPSNNGGYPITSYTAVSSPGSITATIFQAGSGTINLTGLNSNTNYTFIVYATNALGNSENTASSNQITTQSAGVTFTAFAAAIGGGGGGGGSNASRAAGGGGGGGVSFGTFTLCQGCNYCISVGAGGSKGQGTVTPSPTGPFTTGYRSVEGSSSYICLAPQATLIVCGGGGGAGAGQYRNMPAGTTTCYEATAGINGTPGDFDANGGASGGGGGGFRNTTGSVGGTNNHPTGQGYGGGVLFSPGSDTALCNGRVGGGGGGSGLGDGRGATGEAGISCGAPLTTAQRSAINGGGNGGGGRNVNDGSINYGTFGGGGGGSRTASSPTTLNVCAFLAPGGGIGGDWGGTGAHQYQASGGQDGTSGSAPGGGGGGAGSSATITNCWQIAPQGSPTGGNGKASGNGGAGHVILSYPSDKPALSYIAPTLVVSNGPTGTISSGRRYYCFSGGTGTITG